ncbi:MAG: hypothetical protein AAGB26_07390 [Planctomycetota bacterium]
MPYVDEGKPDREPIDLPPILPAALAVVAAGVGAASWLGCFKWFNMSYPGAIVAGLLIGLAVKSTLTKPIPQFRIVALVLTLLACVAGYIWVFAAFYTNFSLGASLINYLKDFQALIFTGVGCYIAFALAAPRLVQSSQEGA